MIKVILILLFINFKQGLFHEHQSGSCLSNPSSALLPPKFLLYDINPPEGFNLRRDVYVRIAVFMKEFSRKYCGDHWHLVLPPWHYLYHWKSRDIGDQGYIPWSHFFDVASLKRHAPVVEMHEFFTELKENELDLVYALQNFEGAFSDGWKWEEKWSFEECSEDHKSTYRKVGDHYQGWFWGYKNMTSKDVLCVSFQGHAGQLEEILNATDERIVMVDRGEVVLHDRFGNEEYWKCRRSMRFAKHLVEEANKFREKYLNSTDSSDKTSLPDRWESEKLHRSAVGGNYLAVHLRRRDFTASRNKELPTLEFTSYLIDKKLKELSLDNVFIATDAPVTEIEILEKLLPEYKVHTYHPNLEKRKKLKDGGVAIVDQIICSRARYFIGSYESTFSFRIQEEREILGFPPESTFNRLCPSEKKCSQPSQWLIVH